MTIVLERDTIDDTAGILFCANSFCKGINPILPPSVSKKTGRLGSFASVGQTMEEKENFEFKTVKIHSQFSLSYILLM